MNVSKGVGEGMVEEARQSLMRFTTSSGLDMQLPGDYRAVLEMLDT